ncbi:MAG: GxxExxY protein [Planctomycetaceae bacterium]|nr:GxxExxY protein [Planctomycetaceae bacterium]
MESGRDRGEKERIRVEDPLTECIICCVVAVHRTLGPGFLESVYRKALLIELRNSSLRADTEREFPVFYAGQEVGRHRLDLLVEDQVILELKTVEALNPSHYAQVRFYLKATGLRKALLINFSKERSDFRRIER